MKKLGILFFVAITLLFASLYVAPSVHAEPETVDFTYTVVNKANPSGQGDTMPLPFGAHTSIDFSGLEGEFGYYVHNGQLIESAGQAFTISGSTNLIVVMKENAEDVVASFVDTNGEFLGAVYNPETEPTVVVSVSKPGYNFTGFGETSSLEDAVYVAQYSRINEGPIAVSVVGGTKDLEEVKYNDVVTLSPNSGNFSYWADEDGQVVSRSANYAFSALQDVELTAVFDQPESDAPVVYLSNVTGISPENQSFLGYVEGDFVEYGLLASKTAEVLTVDSVGVEVIPSTSLHPETNEFLRSVPEELEYVSFRAYAKLANGDVVYSDNNFANVNALEYSFDFGLQQSANYLSTSFGMTNLVNQESIEIQRHRVAINDSGNTSGSNTDRQLVLSPRADGSNDGQSWVEFNFDKLITYITFDAWYWNSDGANLTDSLYLQYWSDSNWVSAIDLKQELGGTLSSQNIEYYFEQPVNKVRIFATRVQTSANNNARSLIDNVKTYNVVNSKLYEVRFIDDDIKSVAIQANHLVEKPEDPVRIGYEFVGWILEDTNEEFGFETPITRHIKLVAWFNELNSYSVSFDLNGGQGEIEEKLVYEGETIDAPTGDLTHDTLVFAGWTLVKDGDELFSFDTPITNDITLYAKWVNETSEPIEVYAVDLRTQTTITSNSYAANSNVQIFNDTIKGVSINVNSVAKPTGAAQGLTNTTDPLFFAVNNNQSGNNSIEKAWIEFNTTEEVGILTLQIYVGNNFINLNGKSVLQIWNGTSWEDYSEGNFTNQIITSLTEYNITISGFNATKFRLLFTGTGAGSNGGQFVVRNVALYKLPQ